MNNKYLVSLSLATVLTLFAVTEVSAQQQPAKESAAEDAKQSRDAASGLPTGKRQHKPVSVTKHIDKATPKARAGYRLCPDGTKINPGEKCPEKKARAGYRLCPDGTKINPGEKCPEKAKRSNDNK